MRISSRLERFPGFARLARRLIGWPVLPRLELLDSLPRASVGAEIGVDTGAFSALILQVVAPRRLHLIDPWSFEAADEYGEALYGRAGGGSQASMDARYEAVKRRFRREIASAQVVVHRAPSSQAAGELADGSLDWVYVDGNHLYEYVRRDLELYAPKIRPGGLLVGDDYGVVGWWDDGVRRAVDEFVAQRDLEIQIIGHQFVLAIPQP